MPEYSFLLQILLPGRSISPDLRSLHRLSVDALGPDRLLEQGLANVPELGYAPIQSCKTVGKNTTIVVGESTEIAVPVGNGQPLVVITLSLQIAARETFLTMPPSDSEDIVG